MSSQLRRSFLPVCCALVNLVCSDARAQPSAERSASAAGPLGKITVRGHYEHPMSRWNIAARISDPWHPGDYFLYRLPEGLQLNEQSYLAQKEGVSEWPTVQPDSAPEWRIDETETTTGYTIRFYDGIELSVEISAGTEDVTFRYVIRNQTRASVQPHTGSCFMLWTAPHFIDRRHERTFIWSQGKATALSDIPPTPAEMKRWPFVIIGVGRIAEFEESKVRWIRRKAADHGLVCIDSQDKTKAIGLAWAPADTIFARSTIPCIHSEPTLPVIPPGKAIESTGRLYFSDRGKAAIEKRFHEDVNNGVIRVKLID